LRFRIRIEIRIGACFHRLREKSELGWRSASAMRERAVFGSGFSR
jgi:hypothetical protein